MIRTKCVYDPAKAEDGLRVLVTNGWPRRVKRRDIDVWWPQLGPSVELLTDWRQEKITWAEYKERFRDEMDGLASEILLIGLKELEYDSGELTVITLLCVEHEDNPHCHRHILKKLIERRRPRCLNL